VVKREHRDSRERWRSSWLVPMPSRAVAVCAVGVGYNNFGRHDCHVFRVSVIEIFDIMGAGSRG
jgi:hypothetical protein